MDAKDGKMHAFAVDILGMMDIDSCKYLLCLLSFQWSPNRDQNTATITSSMRRLSSAEHRLGRI